METTVVIHGLNEVQAEEFIRWYEGQGEQDIGSWMVENYPDFPCHVNMEKTFQNGELVKKDGSFHIYL